VQGAQYVLGGSAAGLQNVTGLTTGALVTGAQYAFEAVIGSQITAGTQGIQWAVQCSVAGATINAQVWGSQGAQGIANYVMHQIITTQGAQGFQTNLVAGVGECWIRGIAIMPGSGSPTLGIQAKGVQSATTNGAVRAGSYLKIRRVS
jgi:hypothetical protein